MDENYLDQLLKEVENQNSDLPDLQIEDHTEEYIEDTEQEMEQRLAADAEHIQDVAWSDAEIPPEEISELDELDELADIDMDAMNFDDIDFDDIDVTKMDVNPVSFQTNLENIEDLKIDESYLDESEDRAFEQEFERLKEAEAMADAAEASKEDRQVSVLYEEAEQPETDAFDVDTLMEEVFGDTDAKKEPAKPSDTDPASDQAEQSVQAGQPSQEAQPSQETQPAQAEQPEPTEPDAMDDMEDLFSMLGISGNDAVKPSIPSTDEIPDFEIPEELSDVEQVTPEKKKKTFMDILFGDDEEDTLTPEQEEELAREKEEKRQAKLAKKEEQKAKRAEQNAKKQAEKNNKTAQLAAKKAARQAEDARILAEDGPDKKLNKPLVAIIMLFFFAIGGFVIVGTNLFDYQLVITKATDYFERQKYGQAYREILGVEVKKQDQELKDKIYTVMYVNRQYEAYENHVAMNDPDLALDALIKGLSKYDEYYDDAVALGIEDDFNTAHDQIVNELEATYGLTEADANAMAQLDAESYTLQIQNITAGMDFSAEE